MRSIANRVAKGAMWMVLFKSVERSLGFISTVILARLLVPDDFGLVAMAMSIIAMLELLSAFGFDMALIHNQAAEQRHYNTAWTFEVLIAVLSAVALMILAAPAAWFYDEPRLETVMYILALGTFIQGFENIGVVAFRKELEFNKEFQFLLGKKIASFAVTVPLAFVLQSYWALVAGILVGRFAAVALSYYIHPFRPRFSLSAAHELFHFSKWLLVNNLLSFLRRRSADFIIGKIMGMRVLGLFSISYEIGNLTWTELAAPIHRAVYPGYTKQATDVLTLTQGVLKVSSMVTLLVLPLGAGMALTAELVVPLVLGAKWLDAVPLIQILALSGSIIAMQTNFTYAFLAIGKPRVVTLLSAIHVAVLLPTVVWSTSRAGAVGAAWAYLVTNVMFLPYNDFMISRMLDISLRRLSGAIWRPILATLTMAYVVNTYLNQLGEVTQPHGQLAQLMIAGFIGILIYSSMLFTLWYLSSKPQGAEQFLLDTFLPRIKATLQILVPW